MKRQLTTVVVRSSRLVVGTYARSRAMKLARQCGAAEWMRPDGAVVRFTRDGDKLRQKTWPPAQVEIIHDGAGPHYR